MPIPSELIGTLRARIPVPRAIPYGRPVIGSEASLAGITQQDMLDYYHGALSAPTDSRWCSPATSTRRGCGDGCREGIL